MKQLSFLYETRIIDKHPFSSPPILEIDFALSFLEAKKKVRDRWGFFLVSDDGKLTASTKNVFN
jgi:hypothetical protein